MPVTLHGPLYELPEQELMEYCRDIAIQNIVSDERRTRIELWMQNGALRLLKHWNIPDLQMTAHKIRRRAKMGQEIEYGPELLSLDSVASENAKITSEVADLRLKFSELEANNVRLMERNKALAEKLKLYEDAISESRKRCLEDENKENMPPPLLRNLRQRITADFSQY